MRRSSDDGMVGLLALLLVIVVVAVASIVDGFVVSTLWGWFVTPKFGLPALELVYAIGIALTFRTLVGGRNTGSDDDTSSTGEKIFKAVITPIVTLLFGFVVHLFI